MIKLKAYRYTHGIRITGYDSLTYTQLQKFITDHSLIERNVSYDGSVNYDLKKRYYGLSEDTKTLYIHRNTWDTFLGYCANRGISSNHIEVIDMPHPTYSDADYELFEKYVLRDYQELIAEDIQRGGLKDRFMYKPEHTSARVDLHTGYGKGLLPTTKVKIPNGWTTIGELKVGDTITGWDGKPTKVTGVYPQPKQPTYRVLFEDNRSVVTDGVHLWDVEIDGKREVISTKDILESLYSGAMCRIPLVKPDNDPDIILDGLPDEYLRMSSGQRKTLLMSMLKRPSICPDGSIGFFISTYDDAKVVQYLVRSLGGIATLANKSLTSELWHVFISFAVPGLQIINILEEGESETICISVDHPDKLFIVDDFIVTHNTLTSLASVARLKCKIVVMVAPKYFGIWVKALNETYKNIQGRYMTVGGGDELRSLIDRAIEKDLDDIDCFIVSNITYRTFLEAYEYHGDKIDEAGFNCTPYQFHELLGAGVQINDEYQDDPGLTFRIDIFSNVPKQIYLSATPFTGDKYVTKMINVALPDETKVRLPQYIAYINALELLYLDPTVKPKDFLTPFKNTYNHTRYETIMLKDKKRLTRYLEMVARIAEGLFIKDFKKGQKCLLLFARVIFIDAVLKHLKKKYPKIKIGKHVAGCKYEDLLKNDITLSTIKSAGTGVDIINLRECVMFHATDSEKDNIQILGRCRPLKDFPEVTPRFTWLTCMSIPHHTRYANNKKRYLSGRVLEHKRMRIT